MGCSKIWILFLLTLFLSSCAAFQKNLDYSDMEDTANSVLEDYNPGRPEDLVEYLNTTSLEASSKPFGLNEISITPLDKWRIEHPLGYTLIQEKITFPSQVREGMAKVNRATFYLYRRGSLKGRRVIILLPGLKVGDPALFLIDRYFDEMLKRDYDILFYVTPFHMERREEGKKDGEELFTSNTIENISVIYSSAREIRTALNYLKKEGVSSIGGWGGSIGGGMLLLLSSMIRFDHMVVMTPIVDWRSVTIDSDAMKALRSRLNEAGFSDELLYRAYDRISPIHYVSTVDPTRVMISLAQYDQLTPPGLLKTFAAKWNISRIRSYERSHVTILLTFEMYEDYGDFLDSLNP